MARASGPRERYRAQVRAEIKERAWEQIGTAGASAISLNAIAKQVGMRGPSLYRYFSSRDELITELVADAYQSLADTFHAQAASDAGADAVTLAYALRRWALDHPQRYLLVYGTPVPGYRAPDEVTAIGAQIMSVVLDACAALEGRPSSPVSPFAEHLDHHRAWAHGHRATPWVLHRALTFWTRLHGVLSLELAGHFDGMTFDPALLFEAELDELTPDRRQMTAPPPAEFVPTSLEASPD